MDGLKGSVEGGGRAVTVFAGHIDDFHALSLQIYGGKGHFSSSDVLGQGNPCHVGEHSLKVPGGTAGNPSQLI